MDSINWWGWIVLIGVPILVSFAIGGGVAEFLSKLGVPKAIAGEDNRTFTKYKNLLVEQNYLTMTQKGYNLPHEPSKPLSPKNYVASLKGDNP